jgi:hypothetical protein
MSDTDNTETDLYEWRKFAEYDEANPQIWKLFVSFALDRIRRGFSHYGARDILHRIRWDTEVAEDGVSGFKVNNIWSPYYARKFHAAFPQHDGFFRLRASRADEVNE